MPWNNQGGDQPRNNDDKANSSPWGSPPKNDNPWNKDSRNTDPNNPWGSGPNPDLERIVRKAQDRLQNFKPGDLTPRVGAMLAGLLGLLWLASGFYTVDPNQVGLNLVFGRYVGKTAPGLNYNWPTPIGDVVKLNVTDRNSIDVGARGVPSISSVGEAPEESLMLTGDENIADVKFRVIWQIDPTRPEDFAFNIKNQAETIKAVAESAMREIVGRTQIQPLLTAERKVIEPAAQAAMQAILDSYHSGVTILQVQLLSVDPPPTVISAFRDVTAAQQDRSRFVNEAQAEANRIVPQARGEASQIQRAAEAYREQTVAEARGQTARYLKIFSEYKKAPDVTRERLYLETMERVLAAGDKIVLDRAGALPVLPLNPLQGAPTNAKPAGGQ
ncbi:protease FtsH subunit HflK [Rhodoblastus acidophilus]|uniref:Protein HflK n=1 Tax=Rhodoblastus acidophilus TaxID=1074 RepID=A0A212RTF6_RHOAC|nr:FtsH protease activity modulator HflK [Rhodoblastus acidophilus]MCW2315448.1 membrane protease subunit HflK [Rhodoblastus acidophilus]PPQ40710.1 FtsH protease activity modulator HflK [Rhodoblastus acidophilus]RAI21912.1 FtsH protease activity modulator HflK [Rhodoblastus acidophilus]SNB75793.1 protease FtsH subunit HflK [Rhodoblastus acidophilus]